PDAIQNDRIKEIITLFYIHNKIIPSDAMKKHYGEELRLLVTRMNEHADDYYKSNEPITNALMIIQKIVETWY
ncbi:MAG: hypothetical protein QMB62_02585, partial [Oscillospiraceae bacterium]